MEHLLQRKIQNISYKERLQLQRKIQNTYYQERYRIQVTKKDISYKVRYGTLATPCIARLLKVTNTDHSTEEMFQISRKYFYNPTCTSVPCYKVTLQYIQSEQVSHVGHVDLRFTKNTDISNFNLYRVFWKTAQMETQ